MLVKGILCGSYRDWGPFIRQAIKINLKIACLRVPELPIGCSDLTRMRGNRDSVSAGLTTCFTNKLERFWYGLSWRPAQGNMDRPSTTMITSSNGNIFRVTGTLCRESTGHRWNKGQWRGALMFSLICVWTNGWVNNRDTGDLRRHGTHYDVTVMHHGDYSAVFSISVDIVHSPRNPYFCKWLVLAGIAKMWSLYTVEHRAFSFVFSYSVSMKGIAWVFQQQTTIDRRSLIPAQPTFVLPPVFIKGLVIRYW